MHAIIYGPKTASGWPATGLSLHVNNTITYDFVDKLQMNLPYNWQTSANIAGPGYDYIALPYNSSAAQTTGFTIPQDIVDNGIVLSYIRYFLGPANDTATSAGMTSWYELPYSITQSGGNVPTFNIYTNLGEQEFDIYLTGSGALSNYTNVDIPSEIRIVLIPASQVNTIQRAYPDWRQMSASQLESLVPPATIKSVNIGDF